MAQQIWTEDVSRRGFLTGASGLAAGVVLAGQARAQGAAAGVVRDADVPNELVGRPAEIENELRQPEARGVDWAVAGLGHFATSYQIPALGRARYSELKGLVSGNPDKAAEIARRTGVGEGSIYSTTTSTGSPRTRRSTWSTSSRRTRCTATSWCGPSKPASTSWSRSPWRRRPRTARR